MINKFESLKKQTQEIIDLIANKQTNQARFKIIDLNELLDELFDFSNNDKDLLQITRYQMLLKQLHQKMET